MSLTLYFSLMLILKTCSFALTEHIISQEIAAIEHFNYEILCSYSYHMFILYLALKYKLILFFKEMSRKNTDILEIRKLKWIGMSHFTLEKWHISCCAQKMESWLLTKLIIPTKLVLKFMFRYNSPQIIEWSQIEKEARRQYDNSMI